MPKNKLQNKAGPKQSERVKITGLEQEVRASYIDYAMSVIVSRALPDVRDGLKPVHRRILYAMNGMGLKHSARYRKSATVVGRVIGSLHPHGDQAIYDSLVRMAQEFSLRYPLIDGQGNFGSVDGDSAAAYRYCVSGNSLVITNRCLERIEDISGGEDINVKVLSFNNKVNQASKWFDSGIHPTLKIKTFRGPSLCGSFNHPILTWQSNNKNKPEFKWKLLKDVRRGDNAVIIRGDNLWPKKEPDLEKFYQPQENPRTRIHTLPKKMTPELAFILGAVIAEGYTTKEYRNSGSGRLQPPHIGFCNSDKEFIQEFKTNFKKVFPDCRLHEFKRKPQGYTKKSYFSIEIHSKHVVNFLENLGLKHCRACDKVVPPVLFHATKASTAAFIRAYAEGDGSIYEGFYKGRSKQLEIALISSSRQLLKEIQIILLRFGIDSFLRYGKTRKMYRIYIRGQVNFNLFKNSIGFATKKKINKLSEFAQRNSNNKAMSKTDYIPFLSDYIRNKYGGNKSISHKIRRWIEGHNIDRLPKIKDYWTKLRDILDDKDQKLFKDLIDNNYLFDKIVSVSKSGFQRVYSLKVESACHSFISNGFISHNTEARLTSIAEEMLLDIDEETVDFVPNYDDTLEEPQVLPAKLPNLLLNGSMGIAVGMATNIPPHNLSEVCDAIIHLIDHPKAEIDDLFNFISGPDFPTGGIIFDASQIKQVYAIGKGPIVVRAKTEIVERAKDQFRIIVSELPYSVNKAVLLTKVAELVKNKRLPGIKDIRDESDKRGIRVVFDLKKGTFPKKILNSLFKLTDLQQVFHVNIVALLDGIQPRVFGLKGLLSEYISHRQSVVYRRIEYNLTKTKQRIHILRGLVIAIDHIDAIIKLIKSSSDREKAKTNLMTKYRLSEVQAQAILETRLHQLANLEQKKIKDELKEKLKSAKELKQILNDSRLIFKIIKHEIKELKHKYGDARRTKVVSQGVKEFKQEDLIPNEPAIIILTVDGYIKRVAPESFKTQARGGKGVAGMIIKEQDRARHLIITTTHANLLFFTTRGRVFQLKAYEIFQSKRTAKGQALVNFLEVLPQEKISAILPISDLKKDRYLVMVTKNGVIKKVPVNAFENVRRSGLIALRLRPDDVLKWVKPAIGKDEIILVSAQGQAIRFREKDLRPMSRIAAGVKGMKLRTNDYIVGMDIIPSAVEGKDKYKLLVITENGLGKMTPIKNYRLQARGGVGVKTAKINEKTGKIVGGIVIAELDGDLLLISRLGQIIRLPFKTVPQMSRTTQGVKLMRFKNPDDKVGSFNLI